MKSQARKAVALFGGVTILTLVVGFGVSELSSSTTTPIATPTSSVAPAPPAADPGQPARGFEAPGGGDGAGAPPTGIIVSPHPAPTMPGTNPTH